MTSPADRRIRAIGRRAARALVASAGQGAGRPLIAAVSGGADSSAMLLLLTDTQSRHGWRIRAAHVDHLIQSDAVRAGFRDAAAALAARVGVPFDLLEADAPSEADASSDGLEASARRVRYAALAQLALERGAPIVAVAHTQDDQAETVLLHILRGSGIDGLSGMPSARPLNDEVRLVRPLLDATRTDTEAVCRAYGWSSVHDPSNDELERTRNRVRHALLPPMTAINPNVAERLAQLARSARSDRELLDLIGEQTLERLRDEHGELGALPRRAFISLPGQSQTRVLRALCREGGIILSAERTAAALQVIQRGRGLVELPGGGRLSVADGTIRLTPACPPPFAGC